MLVSIIIPAYNSARTLPACLEACRAQDYPDIEIIVVDDGSTDDTAVIAEATPGVQVLSQKNQGPAVARNHGARVARGEILAYTDSDCVPRPDWIRHLVAAFETGVVAVGGTYDIINAHARLARVVQAEIAARHARFGQEVDFLGSFNVAYRKEAFDAVGGFEESYRWASGEDNDLAYKLQHAQGRILFTADAIVGHHHPERLVGYLRTQARHGCWRVKLYRDHPQRAGGGDQYAGWPDLLAPPLSLVLAAGAPIAVASWLSSLGSPGVPCFYGGLLLIYGLLHVPIARRLRARLSWPDLLYCWLVLCVRDLARALGLVHGLWKFGMQRNGAA